MFGFGKKSKICDLCKKDETPTKIVNFDPTSRGVNKTTDKPQSLCTQHLKEVWLKSTHMYTGTAVCFLPYEGYNSYSYGTFDEIKQWGIHPEMLQKLEKLLAVYLQDKVCQDCQTAVPVIYYNFTIDEASKTDVLSLPKQFYCWKHFIERIVDIIDKGSYQLDELNTPYGSKGVYMQGEY